MHERLTKDGLHNPVRAAEGGKQFLFDADALWPGVRDQHCHCLHRVTT